jgi:hypothetical protein
MSLEVTSWKLTGMLVFSLLVQARPVRAQCTDATAWDNYVSTSATMGGSAGQYVAITARTQEPPLDPCNSSLQSEAWLNPGGTPSVRSGTGTVDATATWSGNFWGVWTGTTKHWYIYNGGAVWRFKGSLDRTIDLGQPQPPPDEGCGGLDEPECPPSPILIAFDRGGYHLTSATDGVWFDMTGDGVLEHVAWTIAESHVGFLAYDRNSNGTIDNGTELFGNFSILSDGNRAPNGFVALLDLDGGPGQTDGKIDSADAIFSKLLIWTDLNHNGFSEPDELLSLAKAGVDAIYTGYQSSQRRDRNGNEFRFEGSALLENGRGHAVPRKVFDVFLSIAR